jgi:hypothetical protein
LFWEDKSRYEQDKPRNKSEPEPGSPWKSGQDRKILYYYSEQRQKHWGDDKPNIWGVRRHDESPSPESPKLLIDAGLVEGYLQAEPL